jgi:hypothetical protein
MIACNLCSNDLSLKSVTNLVYICDKLQIGKPDPNFGIIGCAWYCPNMRIAKFSRPITSLDLARELAERMLI